MNNLLQYARERLPARIFLPAAAGIALAASAGGPLYDWKLFTLDVTAALCLLFQFRLWDDLADLPYDRIHHPDRLLSQAVTGRPFVKIVWLLGVAAVGILFVMARHYVFASLLNVFVWGWYRNVSIATRRTIPGRHVLLLKYPAFVFAISGRDAGITAVLLPMAAVYLCSGIYELVHDAETRSQTMARILVFTEGCLLGALAVASVMVMGREG